MSSPTPAEDLVLWASVLADVSRPVILKSCACCLRYTSEDWRNLRLLGMDRPRDQSVVVETRQCLCGVPLSVTRGRP